MVPLGSVTTRQNQRWPTWLSRLWWQNYQEEQVYKSILGRCESFREPKLDGHWGFWSYGSGWKATLLTHWNCLMHLHCCLSSCNSLHVSNLNAETLCLSTALSPMILRVSENIFNIYKVESSVVASSSTINSSSMAISRALHLEL